MPSCSASAPELVSPASHDAAWLSWDVSGGATVAATSTFRVHQLAADDASASGLQLATATLGATGLVARASGLRASGRYRFAIECVAFGASTGQIGPLGAPVLTAAAPDVLMLIGGARLESTLAPADAELQRHLNGMGLRVHPWPCEQLTHESKPWPGGERPGSPPAQLLAISPTCDRVLLPAGTEGLPVLALCPRAWPALGLGQHAGTARGSWMRLLRLQHALRADLPPGRAALYRRAAPISYALPPAGALVIAAGDYGGIRGDRGEMREAALAFGVEAAGTRRVGYGVGSEGLLQLSADGRALLTSAVRWALSGDGAARHVPEVQELFVRQHREQARRLQTTQMGEH